MESNTVVLFGAGATKACGGPLTNEILPQAFEPNVRRDIEREYYINLLDQFLIQNFHLPQKQADRTESDFPALPLLLSLVDTAIDRNQPMGPNWPVDTLRQVRRALQYMVFALLNIYGALPLADKFSEYHTGRGIYHTTIEYLSAFPVDYGLIDAYVSADGPFGIFADPEPNDTYTIIGGNDLVAVDWVGASKMGIEPKISEYMELAVKALGKPKIHLRGDPNPYQP